MNLSDPFRSLLPAVDSAVLTVLTESTKPRTGREVARLAGRSQGATQMVLSRFVDHGLVLRGEAGRARVYTLNWDHLAAQPIAELANLRTALLDRLREAIEFWHLSPVHVSVFGSAARGDGGLDSDIDIFMVRPLVVPEAEVEWRRQVQSLSDAVFQWTGNHAAVAEIDEEDLDRIRRDRPPIVDALLADAVDIIGLPVRQLLRRG